MSEEKKKTKRARGKRIGIKILKEEYEPALKKIFDAGKAQLDKVLRLKKTKLVVQIREEVGFDETMNRLMRIVAVAYAKHNHARNLMDEAEALRSKANTISKLFGITHMDDDDYDDTLYEDSNPDVAKTFPDKNSPEIDKLVNASVYLHMEWLDFKEMEYWAVEHGKMMTRAIAMEDAVDVIDSARAKVKEILDRARERDHGTTIETDS